MNQIERYAESIMKSFGTSIFRDVQHFNGGVTGVTFVQIQDQFHSDGINYNGNASIYGTDGHSDYVLWSGWNSEAVEAFIDLLNRRIINVKPTQPLWYMIKGQVLQLPIYDNSMMSNGKTWMPVVIDIA